MAKAKKANNLRWLQHVIASKFLLSSTKTVAAALLQYMDFKTLCDARPGVPNLVTDTGLSERTVQYALKELLDFGFTEEVEKGWPGHATTYRGLIPRVTQAKVVPLIHRKEKPAMQKPIVVTDDVYDIDDELEPDYIPGTSDGPFIVSIEDFLRENDNQHTYMEVAK